MPPLVKKPAYITYKNISLNYVEKGLIMPKKGWIDLLRKTGSWKTEHDLQTQFGMLNAFGCLKAIMEEEN